MNTAVINVKVSPGLKAEAQSIAEELGFSLSSLVNACLKQVVRTKTVTFSASEIPSDYLAKALKESAKDIKAGRVVSFKSEDEVLGYLDKMARNGRKAKSK